jgi:tripartite-type tricarboxylate transporter receptor subunit TctC
LSEQLGQQIVVDNRPGANGNIGAEITAKAPPDGYTLLMSVSADAINAGLYPKLSFSLVRDFAAVGQVAATTFMLLVHPSVQAHTPKQLVDLALSRPRKLNYATFGAGGIPNLPIEMLKAATGANMVQISYRGSGPALADVVVGSARTTQLARCARASCVILARLWPYAACKAYIAEAMFTFTR